MYGNLTNEQLVNELVKKQQALGKLWDAYETQERLINELRVRLAEFEEAPASVATKQARLVGDEGPTAGAPKA